MSFRKARLATRSRGHTLFLQSDLARVLIMWRRRDSLSNGAGPVIVDLSVKKEQDLHAVF